MNVRRLKIKAYVFTCRSHLKEELSKWYWQIFYFQRELVVSQVAQTSSSAGDSIVTFSQNDQNVPTPFVHTLH